MFIHKATEDPFNITVLVKLRFRDRIHHASAGSLPQASRSAHCGWQSMASPSESLLILSFHPECHPCSSPISHCPPRLLSEIFPSKPAHRQLAEDPLHFNRNFMVQESLHISQQSDHQAANNLDLEA